MEETKSSAQENVTIFTDAEWRASLTKSFIDLQDTLTEFYDIARRVKDPNHEYNTSNEIFNRSNISSKL